MEYRERKDQGKIAWLRIYEWLIANALSQSAVNTAAQSLKLLCTFIK